MFEETPHVVERSRNDMWGGNNLIHLNRVHVMGNYNGR